MNYTDRQGADTKAQRNRKKGKKKRKQKMGIGTQALLKVGIVITSISADLKAENKQ